MNCKIALIKGDGIGPEVISSAVSVLEKIGLEFGHIFDFTEVLAGGCAIDAVGEPLPDESVRICKGSDAVLLGAVGGPKWDTLPGHKRPERALLGIRKELGLFANLRPVRMFDALSSASPLRPDIAGSGIDMIIVRELTGGIYYGERGRRSSESGVVAHDTESYSVAEIERIGLCALELAMKRGKNLVSVDKYNVLESSKLWRETMHCLLEGYPQVRYRDMLVDNAAMQLIRDPAQFDVIVTSNMFGDILSDEASVLTGSIGLLPSASTGTGTMGLYEPIHGSAPDIAGQGKANPIAAILSAALMLRYSLSLFGEAECIEAAVDSALRSGLRTADLVGSSSRPPVSTYEMTKSIINWIGK